MTNKVFLKDLRLHAYHGVLPQENKIGSDFIINIEFDTDFTHAMETDELSGTVNYASVLEIIKGEMAMPSKLLEHVGGRIVKTIFSTFSDVSRVKLQIVKENPPFGADCKGAGIEIEEFRH